MYSNCYEESIYSECAFSKRHLKALELGLPFFVVFIRFALSTVAVMGGLRGDCSLTSL